MRDALQLLRDAMVELGEVADWDSIPDDVDNDEALKDADSWPETLSETDRKCLASAWEYLTRCEAALVRASITASRSTNTPDGTR